MDKSLFESLKASLNEAIEHAEGKKEVRTRKITIKPVPNFTAQEVKKIRKQVNLTQALFAQMLGVSKKNGRSMGSWNKYPEWICYATITAIC